jgi:hypothetical protein
MFTPLTSYLVLSSFFLLFFACSFERSYDKLMSVERTLEAEGSKKILDCVRADRQNPLLVHNYYSNKFDTTGNAIVPRMLSRLDLSCFDWSVRVHLHVQLFSYVYLILFIFCLNVPYTVAWNDFDAVPRASCSQLLTDHGGSRKRLLFSRRELLRTEVADIMQHAPKSKNLFPDVNFRRVNMITDPAVENS